MTHIHDILNPRELTAALANGFLKAQHHPTLPLVIYNYTPKTQYERVWNDVTRRCRGLIVNVETGEIVARPFPKFFNYGEDTSTLDLDAVVTVSDKADGSLGIAYPTPGVGTGWSIATRGSFTSDQAEFATKMLWTDYADWTPPEGVTVLFEIIYPENRIVLDYGDARELRLIDALWIDRGWPLGSDPNVIADAIGWPGPVVQHLGTMAMKRALEIPPRENAEGIVVRYLDTDVRIKIKQDDYVALHRIMTGTTARKVWEYLAVDACRNVIDPATPKHWGSKVGIDPKRAQEILAIGHDWSARLLDGTPDEFFEWVAQTSNRLRNEVMLALLTVIDRAEEFADDPEANPGGVFNRAAWFALVKREEPELCGLIVAHHDGADITAALWKRAYPGVDTPFRTVTEDAA